MIIYIGVFFQTALSAIPKIDIGMLILSLEMMLGKRPLHKYVHMYAYIHIYLKGSLPTTQPLNLALALQANFLEWRFKRFGKELVIYSKI